MNEAVALPAGKTVLAAALADLERRPDADDTLALLDAAYAAPRAHVIGVTGPPGVGKSTLLGVLIARWRAADATVGVIAVDPSSRISGGALLGDRTRIKADPADAGIFIRSMAARDRLGGVAALTWPASILLRALYDVVVVETVGVGQSETEIADLADTVVLCLQPGSGDSLQYMKAGIAEVPDVVVVTKADRARDAARTQADAQSALGLAGNERAGWTVPVLLTAARGDGVDDLIAAIDRHNDHLTADGRREARRAGQARAWLEATVRDRFGRAGLDRLGDVPDAAARSPFAAYRDIVSASTA